MKVSEIVEFLSGYKTCAVSAKGIGGKHDVTIRTQTFANALPNTVVSSPEALCETHLQQIQHVLNKYEGMEVYVRSMTVLRESLDNDGEFEGYVMRTRLVFGEPGKCITQEQYDNLFAMGVIGG